MGKVVKHSLFIFPFKLWNNIVTKTTSKLNQQNQKQCDTCTPQIPFLLNDLSLSELSDSEQGDERLQKWKYYIIFIFHKPCACLAWIIVPWSCTKKSYILGESSSCFSVSCQDFPYQGDKGTPPPISRKSAHAPHLDKFPPVDPTPTTPTPTTKA